MWWQTLPANEQLDVHFENAMACLELKSDNQIPHLVLHFICSMKKGFGSVALVEICKAADILHLPILLTVYRMPGYARKVGIKPLTEKQLVDWYTRHDFTGETKLMERKPKCLPGKNEEQISNISLI